MGKAIGRLPVTFHGVNEAPMSLPVPPHFKTRRVNVCRAYNFRNCRVWSTAFHVPLGGLAVRCQSLKFRNCPFGFLDIQPTDRDASVDDDVVAGFGFGDAGHFDVFADAVELNDSAAEDGIVVEPFDDLSGNAKAHENSPASACDQSLEEITFVDRWTLRTTFVHPCQFTVIDAHQMQN